MATSTLDLRELTLTTVSPETNQIYRWEDVRGKDRRTDEGMRNRTLGNITIRLTLSLNRNAEARRSSKEWKALTISFCCENSCVGPTLTAIARGRTTIGSNLTVIFFL